jgi:hypothetical protein
MLKTEVCPQWGHVLLTPEGIEIRVPNIFEALKLRGLVERDIKTGHYRLLPRIDAFNNSEHDAIMGELRRILGRELEGPEWVKCRCSECHRRRTESPRRSMPNWNQIRDQRQPGLHTF